MANASTKKKKTPTASNSRGKSKRKQQPTPLSPRQKEIISVAIMALALLLLCCIALAPDADATEEVTALGAVSLLLLGLMRFLAGSAAVTLPLCLLLFGVILLIGRNRLQGGLRAIGMLILWVAFLGLFSLPQPLGEFMPYMKLAAGGAGGGFIGSLLAFVLQAAFGSAGSLIILLALAVVGLLLFTDTSLAELLRRIVRFFAALLAGRKAQPAPRKQKSATVPSPTAIPAEDTPYAQRRTPFIISHNDPAPLISEPETTEDPIPPTPNHFSNEFLPDINAGAEKPAKGRKAKPEAVTESSPGAVNNASGAPDVERDAHTAPETARPAAAPKPKPQPMPSGVPLENAPLTYILPPASLIEAGVKVKNPRLNKAITDSISLLENTLNNFGVKATVTQVVAGPAVTRYELQPAPGVKVARIVSLSDDIALALAATAVRIEAPIPGKSAIGIEVARESIDTVYFREVMDSPEFTDSKSKLSFALGKNIAGEPIVGDLAKMPHLLIAGSTGSGKSICVNSILCSILYKAKPNEVKLMLIDPKKVEMAHYNVLPHLVAPVVTDSKKAANALKWVVNEMENRYTLFVSAAVKDFASYNAARPEEPLPQIVVVIDELADLMMVAKHDVEDAICRIAQMARAAGIHLLVATQRPSVDVITGLIKANIPSRIAFAVSSYTDSRTILDMGGAEKLLGRGDMLYSPIGSNKPLRVQGSFMQETEILKLVEYCAAQAAPRFVEAAVEAASGNVTAEALDDVDELFYEAGSIIISSGQASTSYLQRRLSIGNPRAARLIDQLAEKGVVGGPKGAKPRDILMDMDEFQGIYGEAG